MAVPPFSPFKKVLPSKLRMTLMRLRTRYDERPADAVSLQDAAAESGTPPARIRTGTRIRARMRIRAGLGVFDLRSR